MTQDDPVSTSFFLAGLKLDLNEELVRGFEVGLGYFIGFSQLYRVFFPCFIDSAGRSARRSVQSTVGASRTASTWPIT